MGKTNYVILGIGLVACVMLSLMMRHAVNVSQERKIAPIVSQLVRQFGHRFANPPTFKARTVGSHRIGELVVFPQLSTSKRRLARTVGDYCWQNVDGEWQIDALVVVCDDQLGRQVRFDVPSPKLLGAPIRELGPNEEREVRAVGRVEPARPTSRPTSVPVQAPQNSAPAK
ncbi:MAG: hypothetical protein KDB80_04830 [Planctomycetes bacterium]|nr:hypothetical protein [Planctomycetota bacterium]